MTFGFIVFTFVMPLGSPLSQSPPMVLIANLVLVALSARVETGQFDRLSTLIFVFPPLFAGQCVWGYGG